MYDINVYIESIRHTTASDTLPYNQFNVKLEQIEHFGSENALQLIILLINIESMSFKVNATLGKGIITNPITNITKFVICVTTSTALVSNLKAVVLKTVSGMRKGSLCVFSEVQNRMLHATHLLTGGYFHAKNEIIAVSVADVIKQTRIHL